MNEQLDFYANYNASRYVHFRNVPTGEYEIIEAKRNGKLIPNRKPIFEKRKLNFEEVKNINLDNYGQDVRTAAEDFTLIHNYLLDFWSAIMGADAVLLYIHLKRYCFAGKDFCFPNMETIRRKMKKGSKATINKHMDILEEHGFIAKIHRIDTERNNGFASPFFKVRRYVPLLSEELILELPEELKKDHDRFLARTNNIELDESFDPSLFLEDLMKSARLIKSKTQKSKEEQLKREGKMKEYILSQLNTNELEHYLIILDNLKDILSKPSFETWIQQTIFLVDKEDKSITALCANSYASTWIESSYKEPITKVVEDILDIKVHNFKCELYDNFER